MLVFPDAGPSVCWSFHLPVLPCAGLSICQPFLVPVFPYDLSLCWPFSVLFFLVLVFPYAGPSLCWSFLLPVLPCAGCLVFTDLLLAVWMGRRMKNSCSRRTFQTPCRWLCTCVSGKSRYCSRLSPLLRDANRWPQNPLMQMVPVRQQRSGSSW